MSSWTILPWAICFVQAAVIAFLALVYVWPAERNPFRAAYFMDPRNIGVGIAFTKRRESRLSEEKLRALALKRAIRSGFVSDTGDVTPNYFERQLTVSNWWGPGYFGKPRLFGD
jgi:hypothetical protein